MATIATPRRNARSPEMAAPFALHALSRMQIEELTQVLIDYLDDLDGDVDLEEDDPAGQCDEDCMNTGFSRMYPGLIEDQLGGTFALDYGLNQTRIPLDGEGRPLYRS